MIVKGLATTTRVQARREWMQRRDALQAQYDAAEKALAYTECARLMKGIAVHEQQSESILPSVEDYRTLADRHRRVVTAVEEKCKQLLSAQDFVALEACSEFLITLRSIDASMLVFPAPTELAAVSSVVVPENRSAEVKQDFIIDSDVADPEIGSAVIAVVRDPVAKL